MMGKQIGAGTSVPSKEQNGVGVSTPSSHHENGTEVPAPGYKQTKVGVIPEEWEVVKLGSIATIETGKTPLRSKEIFWNKAIVPWATTTEVNEKYITATKEKISKVAVEELKMKIFSKNTILLAMYGQGKTRGKVALLKIESTINQAFAAIQPNKNYITEFFFDYLNKSYMRIRELSHGSNQDNLNLDIVKSILIPYPPLKEQQKIAQILTTWDDAISKQEALIEAKEQLKEGLMQKLLSGEVRFAGFDEEWEEVRLGDIGEFKTSSVNKIIDENEQLVNLVNYMDVYKNKHINQNFKCSATSVKKESFERVSLKKGDILFTPSSETPDDIGHSSVVVEDLTNTVYSYHLIRFRPTKNLDIGFSGYVFNNASILKEFSRRATGSTRFTLSIKDFNETKANLPSEQEQQKIAQVLTTADKEIALLKEELKTLKEQKRGLMQKLLTGEVRTINIKEK